MLEIFQIWIKEDIKYICTNQLNHFGNIFNQWSVRSGKQESEPKPPSSTKYGVLLAITFPNLSALEKGKKGRKMIKGVIREVGEPLLNS